MSLPSPPPRAAIPLDLPPEVGFLVAAGVPVGRILAGVRLGRQSGTDAATAMLRAGLIDERRFYRALADRLGVPFLDRVVDLHPSLVYPDCLLAGRARLDRPGDRIHMVLAPPGERVAALLRAMPEPTAALSVTTPSALRDAVFAAHGHWIARDAAETLRRRTPHRAYTPGDGRGLLAVLAATLLVGVLLALVSPRWSDAFCALGTAAFLAMTVFRIAAVLIAAPTGPPEGILRDDDDALPVYTVIVALYREARVVPRLLEALRALDYPAAKLDLKIAIEADDTQTRAALARAPLPARFEVIVAPPGEPRTKPRALNVALALARGKHLVVYDAEDTPDPQQLRHAAATFARVSTQTACLQGRLVVDNPGDGWLVRCFAVEYAALFDVLGPALAAWRLPYPLGGTSTHFRTDVLRAVGGWDAWNVTEDADLGMRLALEGYHVGDLPSPTYEEGLTHWKPFVRQRSRWMKGFLQTAITHTRHPLASWRAVGPLGALGAASQTLGTVASALCWPWLTLWAMWRIAETLAHPAPDPLANLPSATGLILIAAGAAAMLLPPLVACARRGWWRLAPYCLVLPFYYVLVGLGAWLGLYGLIRAPSHWAKTEHGLAATSASGLRRLVRARGPAPSPPRPAAGRG